MSEPFKPNDLFSEARKIAQFGYWNYSFKNRKFAFSEEIKNILEIELEIEEYTDFEVVEKIFHPDEYSKIEAIKKDVLNNKITGINTIVNLCGADSSSKYVEIKAKVVGQNDDVILTGTALDITDSYYRAVKSENEGEIFRKVFENSTDMLMVFNPKTDANGDIIDFEFREVNDTFLQKVNTTKSALKNQTLSFFNDEFETLRSLLKITYITGQPQQDRLFFQSFDLFYDVLIYCPTSSTIIAVCRDVSLLVDTDNQLHDSEKKYRELFMRMSDCVLMVDQATGEILDANAEAVKLIGLEREQLLSVNISEVLANVQLDVDENTGMNAESAFVRKGKESIPAEVRKSVYYWYGRKVIVLSVRNMLSHIEKVENIIDEGKWFRELFLHQNNAVLVLNNFQIEYFNDSALKMLGFSPESLKGKTLWDLSPVVQPNGNDSRLKQIDLQNKVLKGLEFEEEWEFQYRALHRFTANLGLSSFIYAGKQYVVASIIDISLKKKKENELEIGEQRWRNALAAGNIGVWEWNLLNNEVYYSDLWKKILGYESDEITNRFEEFEKRVHPDDVAMVFNKIESFVEQKDTSFNVVFRLQTKTGNYKWIIASGIIAQFTGNGRPAIFVGTHYDLTKYKIAINKLQNENQALSQGFKDAKVGIWSLDLKSMILSAPPETLSLLGYEPGKVLSLKDVENQVHPDDHAKFIVQFTSKKIAKEKRLSVFRIFINDELRYFSSFANPVMSENNQLTGFAGFFKDVTYYKQEDLQYKKEQAVNEQFLKHSKQTVVVVQNEEIIYANDQMKSLVGYTFEEYKNAGLNISDLVQFDDRNKVIDSYNDVWKHKQQRDTLEVRLLTRFGREKWVEAVFIAIRYNDNDALLILINDISKRKNYELKLANDEFVWRNIIQNDPGGIVYTDHDFNIICANEAFYSISENHKKIKSKWSLSATFHQFDADQIATYVSEIIEGVKTRHEGEYTLKGDIDVRLSICSIVSEEQNLKGIVFFFENFDLDKKQIEILSERNLTYKKILENANAGIALFDVKGNSVIHNKTFSESFKIEYLEDKSISFDSLSMVKDGNILRFEELVFDETNEISFVYRMLPEKILFFELQKVDLISSFGVLLLVRDITANYKENIQHIEQFKKYFTIFNRLPYGVALLDKSRQIVTCNGAYQQIMGCECATRQQTKFDALLKTDDIDRLIDLYSRFFSGVIDSSIDEYAIACTSGNSCKVRIKSLLFTDEFGDAAFVMQVVEDQSTEAISYESQLKEVKKQTLNLFANELISKVYNYLALIYGQVHLLKQANHLSLSPLLIDKMYDYSNKLLSNVRTLSAYSNQFTALHLEYNPLECIEFALNNTSMNSSIALNVEHFDELLTVKGESLLISVALQNIFENAVDAMPNGGALSIKSEIVYFNVTPTLHNGKLKNGKYVRISVLDSGVGIKPENLPEKIFEPFFSNKKHESYLGIGLTVARKIIQDNQGDIIVSSSKGGTKVCVYLPVEEQNSYNFNGDSSMAGVMDGVKNVLLVDHDEIVRNVTFELLKKMKFNVIAFSNGEQALRFFKENLKAIDFVFVDSGIYVNGDDDFSSAMKIIRPDVKIVVMQSNVKVGMHESKDLNNNLLEIEKPVNIEKLYSAIADLSAAKN